MTWIKNSKTITKKTNLRSIACLPAAQERYKVVPERIDGSRNHEQSNQGGRKPIERDVIKYLVHSLAVFTDLWLARVLRKRLSGTLDAGKFGQQTLSMSSSNNPFYSPADTSSTENSSGITGASIASWCWISFLFTRFVSTLLFPQFAILWCFWFINLFSSCLLHGKSLHLFERNHHQEEYSFLSSLVVSLLSPLSFQMSAQAGIVDLAKKFVDLSFDLTAEKTRFLVASGPLPIDVSQSFVLFHFRLVFFDQGTQGDTGPSFQWFASHCQASSCTSQQLR